MGAQSLKVASAVLQRSGVSMHEVPPREGSWWRTRGAICECKALWRARMHAYMRAVCVSLRSRVRIDLFVSTASGGRQLGCRTSKNCPVGSKDATTESALSVNPSAALHATLRLVTGPLRWTQKRGTVRLSSSLCALATQRPRTCVSTPFPPGVAVAHGTHH